MALAAAFNAELCRCTLFGVLVRGDVADIALDHFFFTYVVSVTDEFHLYQPPIFRF